MKYKASNGVDCSVAGDRAVLFNQATGDALVLNPTGSELWKHLQIPVDADELAQKLRGQYPEVDEASAIADAKAFLENLLEEKLIVAVEA